MTLGTITGDRGRGFVMLLLSGTLRPAVVTAFAIVYRRQGGMAGSTGGAVQVRIIVMRGTGIALMAILAAIGTDHARVASGTILGRISSRSCRMVLVAGIALAPAGGPMTAFTAGGLLNTRMTGAAANHQRLIIQQFMMIGAHIDIPGGGGMTAGTFGGAPQAVVTSPTLKTGSGVGIFMMEIAGLTALMTIGTGTFCIEGRMAVGTGQSVGGSQRMVTSAGIAVVSPVRGVMATGTTRIAWSIVVTGFTGQGVVLSGAHVMLITGLPLVTVLTIIFGHDIRMADGALNGCRSRQGVVSRSRLALMTGVAILLKYRIGMAILTRLTIG